MVILSGRGITRWALKGKSGERSPLSFLFLTVNQKEKSLSNLRLFT